MNRIKWLILAMFIAGVLGHTAYAGDEIAPPPSDDSKGTPSLTLPFDKIPDVVATINGHIITREEVERLMAQTRAMDPVGFDAMGPEAKKAEMSRTIDSMILREVVYQEAVNKKIVVTDEELDQHIEVMKRQYSSEEEFKKALDDAGMTLPLWKEETRKNLMGVKLEEWAVDELKISDEDIAAYYEKNKSDLDKDAVKVSHILLKSEEDAKEAIKELKEKEDFAGIAKKYSLDTFTKDKGGDLGWYVRGELLTEVEDAAFSLSPGQISGPVKSENGYHVIRLEEKKPASGQTLEDHRDHVRRILQQAKWQQFRLGWVRTLLNKTVVWKWSPEEEKADSEDR